MALDYWEVLTRQYFQNTVGDYALALGIILASVVLGEIIYFFINRSLKKITKKTKNRLDDLLVDAVEEPLVVLIFALGVYIAFKTLTIPASMTRISDGVVTGLVILDLVWILIRLIDIVVKEYVKPLTSKTETELDEQLLPIINKGLKLSVLIIGVLIILSTFGINVTALLAGLGVGGLAIALAAKDTIENTFGAFAIFLDKPFKIRDRVVLDGVTGDVMEVGLRSTRIKTLDNTELYIPNAKIVANNIENISRPNRHLAVSGTLTLTYDTSLAKLREGIEIVKKIISETEGASDKYKPNVVFREFASSSLNIWYKYWVDDYKNRLSVMNEVNQKIKEQFEKAKIEFAYPTQTIYLEK
ncbi:MAG TPA: mechanosensitive ion channel family protein [Candidatus Altiarchaeales archaeon]|nr:mechanosensitive ion channel family protein [Candidatus Altiarchaeales archaeon]